MSLSTQSTVCPFNKRKQYKFRKLVSEVSSFVDTLQRIHGLYLLKILI